MTVVVDASAMVAALLDSGDGGAWARSQLRGGAFLTPHLLPVEVMHALRRQLRMGLVTHSAATRALRDLAHFDLNHVAFALVSARAWELRATVTPYDAWYVAIAEATEAPLVTLDARLAAAPGPRCEFRLPPAA